MTLRGLPPRRDARHARFAVRDTRGTSSRRFLCVVDVARGGCLCVCVCVCVCVRARRDSNGARPTTNRAEGRATTDRRTTATAAAQAARRDTRRSPTDEASERGADRPTDLGAVLEVSDVHAGRLLGDGVDEHHVRHVHRARPCDRRARLARRDVRPDVALAQVDALDEARRAARRDDEPPAAERVSGGDVILAKGEAISDHPDDATAIRGCDDDTLPSR